MINTVENVTAYNPLQKACKYCTFITSGLKINSLCFFVVISMVYVLGLLYHFKLLLLMLEIY